jgi:hypothetical protein
MPTTLAESTNKRSKSSEDLEEEATTKKTVHTETAMTKSPHDAFFDKKRAFMTEKGYIGSILVKGIPRDEDEEEEEEEEEEEKEEDCDKYTEEQMNGLRFIMITQNRADKLDEMGNLILGDQAGSCFMMFNTSFSYKVLDSLETIKSLVKKAKTPAQKFDLLFAYTHTVKEYDVWMHDNEGGMDEFTKGLATLWKRLLKTSDEDLGIDTEYTKPALEEFLRQFKTQVESVETYGYGAMKFKYK